MFPVDDKGRDLLFQVIKMQAEALKMIAAVNHAQAAVLNGQIELPPLPTPTPDSAQPKRRHVPQNKELRTWQGCRAYFQRFEAKLRHDHNMKLSDPLDRIDLATACGLSWATIDRVMRLTYDLQSDQWPPSTWPEHLPDSA